MDVSHLEVASVSIYFLSTSPCHQAKIQTLYHDIASKFMIDTGAGVIDADYRGVVFVLLFNLSDKDFQGGFKLLNAR